MNTAFFNQKLNKLLNKARIRDSKCGIRFVAAEALISSTGLFYVQSSPRYYRMLSTRPTNGETVERPAELTHSSKYTMWVVLQRVSMLNNVELVFFSSFSS